MQFVGCVVFCFWYKLFKKRLRELAIAALKPAAAAGSDKTTTPTKDSQSSKPKEKPDSGLPATGEQQSMILVITGVALVLVVISVLVEQRMYH
ncbi:MULTISPECIES: LPXTG cell wall anchor domain-containing protein [Lacticaseibacillus]|uniref:LPXTG cell wall anchor domain-containing protein n=1 Tax=Lacticaseibacillus TaxID=2759736 RepID=UPI00063DBA1A|nr:MULTISPECIES: LPXTG cell wall anchor domain-containing protein [Lacticaseibacillus]KLI75671.1 hypothetical protein AAW28_09245 [Lacticaseibacillus casei]